MDNTLTTIDYYNKTQLEYNVVLSLRKHLGMHYGYFGVSTKNISEAIINMNRVIAQKAGIKKGMRVLDAGCGIGGSAIWLAKEIGCFVTGISLVKHQIERAKKLAEAEGVEKLTRFMVQDFTSTSFPDNFFDSVWALESIGHSRKEKFFKEAYRILKSKGKLIVGDYYRIKNNLGETEQKLLEKILRGWALADISTKDKYLRFLNDAGFINIRFEDVTKNIIPFSRWLSTSSKRWLPLAYLGKSIGVLSQTQIMNAVAAISQREAFEKKLLGYTIFSASKA